MQPVLVTVVFFIAVFLLFTSLYGLLMSKRNRILERLKRINSLALKQELNQEALAAQDLETGHKRPAFGSKLIKLRFLERYYRQVAGRLERARLLYRPQEFLLLSLATAAVFMLVLYLIFSARYPELGRNMAGLAVMVIVFGPVGFMLPGLYLSFRERSIRHKLNSQLVDMLLLLSNYLRAGHSVIRAIELVSREVPEPLSGELKRFIRDVNLGGTLVDSLAALERRTGDEDLGLVITSILIHQQVGGNLAEVLDSINHTIRERIRLKGQIRTLTAQGRLTGMIIGLLPVALAGLISFMHPEFLIVLVTEDIGRVMLAMAIFLQIFGALIIRRIIQIEV